MAREARAALFTQLLECIPFLQERLMMENCDEEEMSRIAHLIQRGAGNARSDDTKSLKGAILDWICIPGEAFNPPLNRNVKTTRGYQHDVTGALLCPAGLKWEDPKVKSELRSGEITVPGDQWPIFLYADCNYNPEEPWDGLLRSKLLVTAYKYIFTSPSSVDDETRATRAGNAHIHGMTRVTRASIATLRHSVAELLDDVEESEEVNALLNCGIVFPNTASNSSVPTKNSALARIRHKRAQMKASMTSAD
ncbi:hypothetical protein A0H81_03294 [Grifola frondosa]|uniref:Uncharacterized protein n=1 Tax=Grifola frondosa TaxID=5627 RepID=A0A1C7MGK3_GRIFR|nr:hypothetical protein A0H81_03294 [Grifola frondosa]